MSEQIQAACVCEKRLYRQPYIQYITITSIYAGHRNRKESRIQEPKYYRVLLCVCVCVHLEENHAKKHAHRATPSFYIQAFTFPVISHSCKSRIGLYSHRKTHKVRRRWSSSGCDLCVLLVELVLGWNKNMHTHWPSRN